MSPLATTNVFETISLSKLEKKAGMMRRTDNKYIVPESLSRDVVQKLRKSFDILTIDNKNNFSYENVYFDDNGLCFEEHHKGKRLKFKARTRSYLDNEDLVFFGKKTTLKHSLFSLFPINILISSNPCTDVTQNKRSVSPTLRLFHVNI